MQCVTLSDSSDTFSGMWRIRSKLRPPALFFSIRRTESAMRVRLKMAFARFAPPAGSASTSDFTAPRGGVHVAHRTCRVFLRDTHTPGVARVSGYTACSAWPDEYSLCRYLSAVMPNFGKVDARTAARQRPTSMNAPKTRGYSPLKCDIRHARCEERAEGVEQGQDAFGRS